MIPERLLGKCYPTPTQTLEGQRFSKAVLRLRRQATYPTQGGQEKNASNTVWSPNPKKQGLKNFTLNIQTKAIPSPTSLNMASISDAQHVTGSG